MGFLRGTRFRDQFLFLISSLLLLLSYGQVIVDRTADYFVYNVDASLVNIGWSIAQGPSITSYTTRSQGIGTTSWYDITADNGIDIDWRATSVLGASYTGGVLTSANNETILYTAGEYVSVQKLYPFPLNAWKTRVILNNRTILPPMYSDSNNPIIDSITGQTIINTNLFQPNNKQTITVIGSTVCTNDEILIAAQINDGSITGSIVTAVRLLSSSSPLCKLVPCISDNGEGTNSSNVWIVNQVWYSTVPNVGRGLSCSSDGTYLVIGSPETNEVMVYSKKVSIETSIPSLSITVSSYTTLSYVIGLVHNLHTLNPWIPIARIPLPRLDTTPPNTVINGPIGLGGWGFGYSTAIMNNGILVVGAPNAGPFTYNETTPYQLINTGATNGGALYVYDLLSTVNSTRDTLRVFTPHSGGDFTHYRRASNVNIQRSLLPTVGTFLDPVYEFKVLCRYAGPFANGNLGISVSASVSTLGHQVIIWGGMPRANRVATLHVSPITRLASVEGYLTGFRITTERDIGSSVSYRDEMGFFGSPSASNAGIVSTAQIGRLYVKAWCQRDRTISWPPSYSAPHVRTCTVCPSGRTSKGTDLLYTDYSTACDLCPNWNQRPINSQWITGAGCIWKCNVGYFGRNCLQCTNYMVTPESSLTNPNALPTNAVWINDAVVYFSLLPLGVTECVWRCSPGFRINQTIVTTVPGYPQFGIGLVTGTFIDSACIPPAPPDTVLPVTVLGISTDIYYSNDLTKGNGITSSSVNIALFVPAVDEPLAPVNSFRSELEFNRTDNSVNEVWDASTVYPSIKLSSGTFFDSPSDGLFTIDIPYANTSTLTTFSTNGTGSDIILLPPSDPLVSRLRLGIQDDLQWPLANVSNITLQPIVLRIRRLLASTTYRVRLSAGNVGGLGNPSIPAPRVTQAVTRSFTTLDPTTPSIPGAPSLLQSTSTSLLLQWDEPFDYGGSLQQTIEICLCKGIGFDNQGIPNSRTCGFSPNGGNGLCDATIFRSMNNSLYPLTISTPGDTDYGYGLYSPTVSRNDVYESINEYLQTLSLTSSRLVRRNVTSVIQTMENTLNFQFAVAPKDTAKGNARQALIRGLPSSTTYYAYTRIRTTFDRSPSSIVSGPLRTTAAVTPTEITNIVWIESEPLNKSLLSVPYSEWNENDEMEIVIKEGIRCQTVSGSQVLLQYGYPVDDGGMPFSILVTLNVVNVSNISTSGSTGNYLIHPSMNKYYWNDVWFTLPDTSLSVTTVVPNIPNQSLFTGRSTVNGLLANTVYRATIIPFNALGNARMNPNSTNNITYCVTGAPQAPSPPIVNPSSLPFVMGGSIHRLTSSSLTFTWSPPNDLGGIPRRQISYQLLVAYSTNTNTTANIPGIGIVNNNNVTVRSYTVSTVSIPMGIENITFNRLVTGTTLCLSVRAFHQGGYSSLSNPFTDPQQVAYVYSNVINVTGTSIVTWSTDVFPWNTNGSTITVSNNHSFTTITTSMCAMILPSSTRAPSAPSAPIVTSSVMNHVPIALSSTTDNVLSVMNSHGFTDSLWITKYGTPDQRRTYPRIYSLWYPVLPYSVYFRRILDNRLSSMYTNLRQGLGSLYIDSASNNNNNGGTVNCNDNLYMMINTTDVSRPTRTAGGWIYLSWLPSVDNGGTPITSYIIEQSLDRKVYDVSSMLIVSVPSGYDGTDMVSPVSVSSWGQSSIRRYILETNNSLTFASRTSGSASNGDQLTDVTEWIDNVTLANGYHRCFGSTSSSSSSVTTIPSTYVTALVYELLADSTYYFRVTAVSSTGTSTPSVLSNGIVTGPGSRPGTSGDVRLLSTAVILNRTSTNLPIEWKPPLDTGGVRVSSLSYSIFLMVRAPNSVCGYGSSNSSYPWFLYTTVTNGVLNTTVNRLFGSTTYGIGIRTNSLYGAGPLMIADANFTTGTEQLPLPPLSSNIQITLTSAGTLRFTFLPSNDDGGDQILGYYVYIATNESLARKNHNPDLVDWIQVANIPANIDTKRTFECGLVGSTIEDAPLRGLITSLLSSTTYIIRVAAYNTVGRGPLSIIDCRNENYRYPAVLGSMCPFGTTKVALPPNPPGRLYLSTSDEIRMALPLFTESLNSINSTHTNVYTSIATVSSSRVWLSWSPPMEENGQDIIEYRIFISTAMDTITVPYSVPVSSLPVNQSVVVSLSPSVTTTNVWESSALSSRSCIVYPEVLAFGCSTLGILPIQGLLPSTMYYARILAINNAGYSRWSTVSNPFTTPNVRNSVAATKVSLPPILTAVPNTTYMQYCGDFESTENIGSSLFIQIYPVWFHQDYDTLAYTIDYTLVTNPSVTNSITIAPDNLCQRNVRLETIYYVRIGNVRSFSLYNITVSSWSYAGGKSNESNTVTQIASEATVPSPVFIPTILPSIVTYTVMNNGVLNVGTALSVRWSGSLSNGGSPVTGYSVRIRLMTVMNQSYTTVFTYPNLNDIVLVNQSMYGIVINGTQLSNRWTGLCGNLLTYCNMSLPAGTYTLAIAAINSIGTGSYSSMVPVRSSSSFAVMDSSIVAINTACMNFGFCNTSTGNQRSMINSFITIDSSPKNTTGGSDGTGNSLRTLLIAPNSVPITSGLSSLATVSFNDYDDYTVLSSSRIPRTDETNSPIDLWYHTSSVWILTWRTGCTITTINGYCDPLLSLPNNPFSYLSPTIQYFVISLYIVNSSSVPLRTVWMSVRNTSSTLLRNNGTVYAIKLDVPSLNGIDTSRWGTSVSIGITVSACNSVGCGSASRPLIVSLPTNTNLVYPAVLPNPSSYCLSPSRCTLMVPSLSILGNAVSHVVGGIYQECRTLACLSPTTVGTLYNFTFPPSNIVQGVKVPNTLSSDTILYLSDMTTLLPLAYNRSATLAMVPKYGIVTKTIVPSDSTNGWFVWHAPSYNPNDVSPTVTVTGLDANTTYAISTGVLFNNGRFASSILNATNHITLTTPVATAPLPPNPPFLLVPTATRLTIGWTVPIETGGVPIIGYVVQGRRMDMNSMISTDASLSSSSNNASTTVYYGDFFIHTSTDTVKTWTIDNILATTYYSFRILALNELAYRVTSTNGNNLTNIQALLSPLYASSSSIVSTINTNPSSFVANGISGWSDWSEPYRTNYPTPPDPPTAPFIAVTGLSPSLCLPGNSYTGCPSITSSSVSLSWLPLTATGGLPLIGYRVYLTQGKLSPLAVPYVPPVPGKTSAVPFSLVHQARTIGIVNPDTSPLNEVSMDIETRGTLYVDVGCTTNVTIIGLQPSMTYSFALTAISAAGEGDASDPLTGITTLPATNPSTPGTPIILSPDILTNVTGLSSASAAVVLLPLPTLFGANGLSSFEFILETVGSRNLSLPFPFLPNANGAMYQTVTGWNHEPVGRIRQWNVSAEESIIGGDIVHRLYQSLRLPLPDNITNNFPSLSGLPVPIVLPGYHRFGAILLRHLSASTAYRIAVSVINANLRRSVRSGWSTVFVTASASLPSSPLTIDIVKNSVTASTVDMTISPPMDDGGAPVMGYIVHASFDGMNWEDDRVLKDGTIRHGIYINLNRTDASYVQYQESLTTSNTCSKMGTGFHGYPSLVGWSTGNNSVTISNGVPLGSLRMPIPSIDPLSTVTTVPNTTILSNWYKGGIIMDHYPIVSLTDNTGNSGDGSYCAFITSSVLFSSSSASTNDNGFLALYGTVTNGRCTHVRIRLTGLLGDNRYFFRVQAVNMVGSSLALDSSVRTNNVLVPLTTDASVDRSTVSNASVGAIPSLSGCARSTWRKQFTLSTFTEFLFLQSITSNWKGMMSSTITASSTLTATVKAPNPVNDLRIDNVTTGLTGTSVSLSWLPPLDHGGQPVLCYRIDTALDGTLGTNIDMCDVPMTFMGYNSSTGYVTSLNPPPCSVTNPSQSVFDPATIPPIGAWKTNAGNWGLVGTSIPVNINQVPVYPSWFETNTGFSRSLLATYLAGDPYTSLNFPFESVFNSTSRFAGSENSIFAFSYNVCISSILDMDTLVHSTTTPNDADRTSYPPLIRVTAAVTDRITGTITIPSNSLFRIRVVPITVELTPYSDGLGIATIVNNEITNTSIASVSRSTVLSAVSGTVFRRQLGTAIGQDNDPRYLQSVSNNTGAYSTFVYVPTPDTYRTTYTVTEQTIAGPGSLLLLTPGTPPRTPIAPVLRTRTVTSVTIGFAAPPIFATGCAVSALYVWRSVWVTGDSRLSTWILNQLALGNNITTNTSNLPVFSSGWSDPVIVWTKEDDNEYPLAQRTDTTPLVSTFTSNAFNWYPLQAIDGPLPRATSVKYTIQAGNNIGLSYHSTSLVTATLPTIASSPLQFRVVSPGISPVSAALAWNPPVDDGGRTITSYRIEVAIITSSTNVSNLMKLPYDGTAWSIMYSVPPPVPPVMIPILSPPYDITYTLTNLVPSQRYAVRITAVTTVGIGNYSSLLEIQMADPIPCVGLPDPVYQSWFQSPNRNTSSPVMDRGRCSGRGRCHPWAGTCTCDAGWGLPGCQFLDGHLFNITLTISPTAGSLAVNNFASSLAGTLTTALGMNTSSINASRIVLFGAGTNATLGGTGLARRLDEGTMTEATIAAVATGGTKALRRSSSSSYRSLQTTPSLITVPLQLMLRYSTNEVLYRTAYLSTLNTSTTTITPSMLLFPSNVTNNGTDPGANVIANKFVTLAAQNSPLITSLGISSVTRLTNDEGILPNPSSVVIVIPDCSQYDNCTACLANTACGWCASASECILGNAYYPAGWTTSADISQCAPLPGTSSSLALVPVSSLPSPYLWYHSAGIQTSCAPPCTTLSDCSTCTSRYECGWCESSQSCVRDIDSVRGTACTYKDKYSLTVYGKVQQSSTFCPINVCRTYASKAACLRDPFCGYCDYGNTATGVCASGDSFGFTDNLVAKCTASYIFRNRTCSYSKFDIENCDTCLAKPGCGFCASTGVCGSIDNDSGLPMLGTCPSTAWFRKQTDGTVVPSKCPSKVLTPAEKCIAASKAQDVCVSCLQESVGSGCALCSAPVTPGAPVCMLLGDALGSNPNGISRQCTSNSLLRGIATTNYSYGNMTLALPSESGRGCATSCVGGVPQLTAPSGTIVFGSAVLGAAAVPQFYGIGERGPCTWLVSPLDLPNASTTSNPAYIAKQFATVTVTFTAWDLAIGDSIQIYDGVTLRTAQLLGTLTGRNLGPNGMVQSFTGTTGYLQVILRINTGGGLGFAFTWAGVNPIDTTNLLSLSGWYLGVVAIIATIVFGGIGWMIYRKIENWLLIRALARAPPPQEETLEMAQARAQRSGRGAPKLVIHSFPVFEYDKEKLDELPLVFSSGGSGTSPTKAKAEENENDDEEGKEEGKGSETMEDDEKENAVTKDTKNEAVTVTVKEESTDKDSSLASVSAPTEPSTTDAFETVKNDTNEDSSPSCAICLTPFDNGDICRILLCRHAYHRDCIDPSLLLNKNCPMCRRDATEMFAERLSLIEAGESDPIQFGPTVKVLSNKGGEPKHDTGGAVNRSLTGKRIATSRPTMNEDMDEMDFMTLGRLRAQAMAAVTGSRTGTGRGTGSSVLARLELNTDLQPNRRQRTNPLSSSNNHRSSGPNDEENGDGTNDEFQVQNPMRRYRNHNNAARSNDTSTNNHNDDNHDDDDDDNDADDEEKDKEDDDDTQDNRNNEDDNEETEVLRSSIYRDTTGNNRRHRSPFTPSSVSSLTGSSRPTMLTGNHSGTSNDNFEFSNPLPRIHSRSLTGNSRTINMNAVNDLMEMGFSRPDVIKALTSANGDVEIAADLLFSGGNNGEDDDDGNSNDRHRRTEDDNEDDGEDDDAEVRGNRHYSSRPNPNIVRSTPTGVRSHDSHPRNGGGHDNGTTDTDNFQFANPLRGNNRDNGSGGSSRNISLHRFW